MPPQNIPLWHSNYFELETNENQQMQKKAFLCLNPIVPTAFVEKIIFAVLYCFAPL